MKKNSNACSKLALKLEFKTCLYTRCNSNIFIGSFLWDHINCNTGLLYPIKMCFFSIDSQKPVLHVIQGNTDFWEPIGKKLFCHHKLDLD